MKELNTKTVNKSVYPIRIVQFGEGNFLRGFVDWMVNVMNAKTDFNGSVVVVQPRSGGHIVELKKQDYMYHVNFQGLHDDKVVDSYELIESISDGVNPYIDFKSFLKIGELKDLKFVTSNTTEAGIAFDSKCNFSDKPAISFPGKLLQLLYHRYEYFNGAEDKGLIILPCELIFENGKKLKDVLLKYIDYWHLGDVFKQWFLQCCTVYSTLVDRITPGFPKKDVDAIKNKIGFNDNQLVQAEAYYLWVIEAPSHLANVFPAAEAGLHVQFVESEAPYHLRKVTLLNGVHTVLAPVAYLSGINIVRDACKHSIVGRFIHQVMFEELLVTLDLPRKECIQFADDVLNRFMNPYIDHQVTSIMLNSFSKYKTRDLPALKKYVTQEGKLPNGLVLGLAAIITFYKGDQTLDGRESNLNDTPRIIELMKELWRTNDYNKISEGVLKAKDIWDEDLSLIPDLTDKLANNLQDIGENGMLKTLRNIF